MQLVSEVTRIIVTEAALRAGKQASIEEVVEVQISHVEKILPQLVSDKIVYC